MESRATSKTKAGFVVLAIFVIGFAAGGLSMNLYLRAGGPGPRGNPREFILKKMTDELALAPEQREQIGAVLDETFSRYSEIRKEMEPRMTAVRQQGREKIRAILTPQQVPKFEEMLRRQDDRGKDREKGHQGQKR
ncbi:MAG TPA: hypothetical protein VJH03_26670 [Blastocatellia bacterium]|nr:hypothetical protein [Blastocatellia bacterium]